MSTRLQEFYDDLATFTQQEQHHAMVIAMGNNEMVYLYQGMTALDRTNRENIYALFPQNFETREQYVTAVIASLEEQLSSVRKTVQEHRQRLADMPFACSDPNLPAVERFVAALTYTRDLIPKETGQRLVWCMAPMEIQDAVGFRDFVQAWLPTEKEARFERLQVIVREDTASRVLSQSLMEQRNKLTLLFQPDLTPAALIDSVVQDVSDPHQPMAQRVDGLFELAMLDVAYQRESQAIEKLWIVHDYAQQDRDLATQCLCLVTLGDLAQRQQQLPLAKEKYLQALTVAQEAKSLPMLMQCSQSVGQVCFALMQWSEAEGFFRVATKIAESLQNPFVLADLHEWIGRCCSEQKKWGEAVNDWIKGVEVCRASGYDPRRVSILERLVQLFTETRQAEQRQQYSSELNALRNQRGQS